MKHMKKNRVISLLLVIAIVMSLFGTVPTAMAAGSITDTLEEARIYNGDYQLAYLAMNGGVIKQSYTYYNYQMPDGSTKEIPAYCISPNQYGVPQTVAPGESIKYKIDEAMTDPKAVGIICNGYPHQTIDALGLDNKYQAFYATKMALWTYLIPSWSLNKLTLNPNLSGAEREIGERVLTAAKKICVDGTQWTTIPQPSITVTPETKAARKVTIDGKEYLEQVFKVHSVTWVGNLVINIAFSDPTLASGIGAKLVDMENKEITEVAIEISHAPGLTTGSYDGKYKILVPAENAEALTEPLEVNLDGTVFKFEMIYALCAEKDKYGNLQNYLLDTDPVTAMSVKAPFTLPGDSNDPPPDGDEDLYTGLKIVKVEKGTNTPLAGAVFEVTAPDGTVLGSYSTGEDGAITIPITQIGHYTVTETTPPAWHLLDEESTKHINTEYGKVSTVTFANAPYGDLRIEKIDAATGESLDGAKVQIKHIESGATYTQETGPGGAAQFTQLKPGAYEIKELAAPDGWQIDPQTYTVTVVSGEAVAFTLKNTALPGLTIIKYDSQTHTTMSGVTFEIFRDTVSLGQFETDALGEIHLVNQQPGTYRVVEVDTGDTGHIAAPPQEIELTAGGGIKTLYFFNDTKPGIWLVKVDAADPSKTIPNAVFTIRAVDGSFGPKEFTTDQNGEIDLSELPTGAYEVVEKSCEGYIIDQAQRIIHLEANQKARFVFTNTIRPSLSLIKLSADGSRLAGVTFRIAKVEDGSHYLDRTTDAQGEILIADLEPGVYSVKETATTSDHLMDLREHHVELFPGRTSTIVLNNDRRPTLVIHKNDADTGAPVQGAVFTVKAANGHTVTEVKTGLDGTATLENLLPIVYEVTEKSVPAPYLLDAPKQLITLYPNRTGHVYFENHKKPSLVIEKLDSITGDPIQGAKFELWYGSNSTATGELNSLGTFYTDANGRIERTNLRDGWYKVTELQPAHGYAIQEPATQECYIKGGEGKVLTFKNTPLSALVVYKYDAKTGEALEGAVFEVCYLGGTSGTGGTVIGTYKTSANGSFTVTGLKAGTYVVEEVRSSPHYTIDSAPQTAYISGEEQDVVTLYFGNQPYGSVLIKKLADDTNKTPLAGAVFLVTDDEGAFIGSANGEFTTDKSGSIQLPKLPAGTTIVAKEIRAPEGYALDGTPQTIKIEAGETKELTFYDKPLCSLSILKRDSATKQPLAGAEFLVTDGAGAPIGANNGRYTSGSDGLVTITGLTPGQAVVVREEKAPWGFVKDGDPKMITVQSNKSNSLTFENAPKGTLIVMKLDGVTKKPLSGATFQVTTSSGELVAAAGGVISTNGLYTTDKDGKITISGVEPDTYVVTEQKAPDGYVADGIPQTVVVNTNDTQTLYFYNTPAQTLTIQKYVEGTTTPVGGVTFLVTDSSGAVVGPDNGLYVTDENGRIVITGLVPGVTVTAKETKTVDGYALNSTPQSIKIKEGEAQSLTFFNTPLCNLTILKRDSATKQPLSGAEFLVTDGTGAPIGPNNGHYTTDRDGRITVSGLTPGQTVMVRETEAPAGYALNAEPQSIVVQSGEKNSLTFENVAANTLTIQKYVTDTTTPIQGVKFLVTDSSGAVVGPNNGEYTTDRNGRIVITGLTPGVTITAKELKAPDGYVLDSLPQSILIKEGEAQSITFYNTPAGGLEIIKTDGETGARLSGTELEVRRMNGERVGAYTTDRDGRIYLPGIGNGWFEVVETKASKGYELDDTPHNIEVKEGETATLKITNRKAASALIHKVDAVTGQGIPGVTFLVSDADGNPIGQYTSDQNGYVFLDKELNDGKFFVREIEPAPGYLPDTAIKTFYVSYGGTTTIDWKNTPTMGQIQITKKSADDNPINGWPAGTLLPNATFEIYDRANNLVDTVVTDKNGLAISKTLPIGRYTIRESQAPDHYAVNSTVVDAEIEFSGQIIRLEVLDESTYTNVSVTKRGYAEVVPGQSIRYDFSNIGNNSTVPLQSFYWRDTLPVDAVRLDKIITGTWNARLSYKITYKTNTSGGAYRTLADNLSNEKRYVVDASPAALGLASNECVTEIMCVFGTVPAGFRQVEAPAIFCNVLGNLPHEYRFANKTDVGGMYGGQWMMASDRWVTVIYNKQTSPKLPRTGY